MQRVGCLTDYWHGGIRRPETADEKVRLFGRLFRGREQVFPVQFTSKKTLKVGYAPACSNKFVRGVCELPKVKCGECPNQAFLAVNDRVLRDHLQGRHVVGVYPLLENETCREEERKRREAEQKRIEAWNAGRREVLAIARAWSDARRAERFFDEVVRAAGQLQEAERDAIVARIDNARETLGGTDALTRFRGWRTPDETA